MTRRRTRRRACAQLTQEEGRSTAAAARLHASVPTRLWRWALSVLRWRRVQAVWTHWMRGGDQLEQQSSAEYGGDRGEAGPLSAVSDMPRPRELGGLHAQHDGGPWTTVGTSDTLNTRGSPRELFGQISTWPCELFGQISSWPDVAESTVPLGRSPLRVDQEIDVGQGRAEEGAWPLPYGARPGRMAWHHIKQTRLVIP